jgi:hypothetical protein
VSKEMTDQDDDLRRQKLVELIGKIRQGNREFNWSRRAWKGIALILIPGAIFVLFWIGFAAIAFLVGRFFDLGPPG